MNRTRSIRMGVGVVLLVLFALLQSHGRGPGEPRLEETRDANLAAQRAFLEAHVRRLERKGDRAEAVADGTLGGASATWVVGFSFRSLDDHGATTYTVAALGDEGAALDYEARFDHRSFGKDLVTIDRGTVVLSWKR